MNATLTKVPAHLVDPGPNDRKTFGEVELQELADSIATHGLAQPPTLRKVGERFEIVAGERRFRAMSLLGWSEVPAIVRDMDDETASAVMLAENVQRADLDPIEESRAYASRSERFGYSVPELATMANVSPERVRKRLALLSLSPEIADMVSKRQMPLNFAACLTSLDVNRQRLAFKAFNAGPISLDAFRALTNKLQMEQDQESIFDPASFLQVEEMVADALATVEDSSTIDEMQADPVGVKDIAARLGVRDQTVATWKVRGLLPEPRWTVSGMSVWQWSDIEKWAKKTGRWDRVESESSGSANA